ncbi:pitrilysin family protein [Streptomyces sp. NPDC006645]|uniref:M16 family metallopeptidase n=1 Tax=unclassified Streptomyces TaxID=2593676 RepID=UPI0033BBCEEE
MSVLTGGPRDTTRPRHLVLDNGLELVGAHRPGAPLAALRLRLDVGSADEAPGEHGLAHVLEHLVVRCSMGGGRVADGALVEAATGRPHTAYDILVRTGDIATAAAVLGAAFRQLRPDTRDLDDELAAIRRERAQRTADVRWRVQEAMFAALWPDSPYAHPVLGDPGTVDGLTPEAVHRFHSRWYRPSRATLVLASDRVDEELAALAEWARPWAPDRPRTERYAAPPPDGHTVVSRTAGAGRRVVAIGFTEPTTTHGAGSAAGLALARRFLRAARGIDVIRLRLRNRTCTWVMLSAADETAAVRSVAAALRAVHDLLLGPDGAALLRTEALIPELRSAEDIQQSVADVSDRAPAARSLAATGVAEVAEAIAGWRRGFAAAPPEGPAT